MAMRPKMKSKSQSDRSPSRVADEQSEISRIVNLCNEPGGLVQETMAVIDWVAREVQSGCNSYVIRPQIQKDRLIEMPALEKVVSSSGGVMRQGD